jgi:hypothetical protein
VSYCRMITCEITTTGPKDYQVIAISPEWHGVVVGDSCSHSAAEAFADRMRLIDADSPRHAARSE